MLIKFSPFSASSKLILQQNNKKITKREDVPLKHSLVLKELCTHMDIAVETLRKIPAFS